MFVPRLRRFGVARPVLAGRAASAEPVRPLRHGGTGPAVAHALFGPREGDMKLRRGISFLLPAVLAVSAFVPATPAVARAESPAREVVRGNTAFAVDLYAKLKAEEGNLFFSPYSISTALAMTYAGARGKTQEQMSKVLHFGPDAEALHAAFGRLGARLNAVQKRGGVELSVANALWAQKDYRFLTAFLDLTKKHYGAAPEQVDFRRAAEAARRKINAWVERRTKNKIRELIKPGVLNPLTRLVLTNAIYFKGAWRSPFKERWTRPDQFRLSAGKSVRVPMMNQTETFGYREDEERRLQILELPYKGNDVSMVVLLPRKVDGLGQIENALSVKNLAAWTGRMKRRSVRVILPRFKMTSQFGLAGILAAMGMPDAFDERADFSGMDGRKWLYISAVIHKAFVDVNERGTEAAAATAVVAKEKGIARHQRPPVFRADHPFLFVIRENRSGSILFLGRVANPQE